MKAEGAPTVTIDSHTSIGQNARLSIPMAPQSDRIEKERPRREDKATQVLPAGSSTLYPGLALSVGF